MAAAKSKTVEATVQIVLPSGVAHDFKCQVRPGHVLNDVEKAILNEIRWDANVPFGEADNTTYYANH